MAFYSVLADQSHVLLQAMRNGVTNVFYVSAANLRNEIQLNHPLNADDELLASQVGGLIPGPTVSRIGYWIRPAVGQITSYVAEISATPNPLRRLAGRHFADIRHDMQAALLDSRRRKSSKQSSTPGRLRR